MRKTLRNKKFTLVMALVMILSLQMNFTGIYAEEVPAQVEAPSAWALEDVQMAAIYGVAAEEMFGRYTDLVSEQEMNNVVENLYEIFTDVELVDNTSKDVATRLDVVKMLYGFTKVALPEYSSTTEVVIDASQSSMLSKDELEAVKFVVGSGLLKGKVNNKYDLESACSRQELLVFAKRAYDFVVYETGQDAKGAFWKVTGGNNTIYLLGSIHVADNSIYPMSKEIMAAYNEADELVVEANILNVNQDMEYIQQKMFFQDETTIDKVISADTYKLYVDAIKPLGVQPEIYNKLKPWYAAILLQSVQLTEASYSASLGVDLFFLSKATGQKDIVELEGTRFQIDMFDSFSKELQEQYLLGVLTGSSEGDTETEEIMEALMKDWKTGDVEDMEKILFAEDGSEQTAVDKEFYDKVLEDRNVNMIEKISGYLEAEEEKTYFVVVGAGHMLGDSGIVKELQDMGYVVE